MYAPLLLIYATISSSFSFKTPPTTYIYTLSLHDALPISIASERQQKPFAIDPLIIRVNRGKNRIDETAARRTLDRKSTRLNSSHDQISYAVFCLQKKKTQRSEPQSPARHLSVLPVYKQIK